MMVKPTLFAPKWITPFMRQCFVVTGVSVNMGLAGMGLGFVVCFLPQLREARSTITIDDDSASWLASLPGITQIAGGILVPPLMGPYGRRITNIVSILIVTVGWLLLVFGQNLAMLMTGRFLHGVSSGMVVCLGPIAIGEYSSPKNRGSFSLSMSFILGLSTFVIHTLGSYLTWRQVSMFCTALSLVDLVMVILSPETPSWLADHGRYEECQEAFRWLRGDDEEDELAKMIEANKVYNDSKSNEPVPIRQKVIGLFSILKEKEFYKPIIIVAHLFPVGQVCGAIILASYMADLVDAIVGKDVNAPAVIMSVDLQRLLGAMVAIYVIRLLKRRTLLGTTVGLNIVILLVLAGYLYAKQHQLLPWDHPAVGGLLLHLLMLTVTMGCVPLPFTIAGEIFPIKYRSVSGGICMVFLAVAVFAILHTFTYLVNAIEMSGAFCIYAAINAYCLAVVFYFLPETKDKTLQDIEEEIKK